MTTFHIVIISVVGLLGILYFTIIFRRKEENYDPPDIDSSLDDERLFDPISGSYLTLEEIESGRHLVPDDLKEIPHDVPEHYKADPYLQAKLKLREIGFEKMEDEDGLKDHQVQFFEMNLGLDSGDNFEVNEIYEKTEITFYLITVHYDLPHTDGDNQHSEPQIATSIPLKSIHKNWTVPLNKFMDQTNMLIGEVTVKSWMKNSIMEFKGNVLVIRVRQFIDSEMIKDFGKIIKRIKDSS